MKEKINFYKGLFYTYLGLLIFIVLFKLGFNLTSLGNMRSINLIPFYYENDVNVMFHGKEIVLNILIFVPFGLFLKTFKLETVRTILYGFFLSLLFEIMQYVFGIGASDITDLITNTLGCSGFARVDMFYTKNEKIVFNEVNTIPGCTEHSRYPKMLEYVGYSFYDIVNKLLELGDER